MPCRDKQAIIVLAEMFNVLSTKHSSILNLHLDQFSIYTQFSFQFLLYHL